MSLAIQIETHGVPGETKEVFDSLMKAARAWDGGNEKALLELVRYVRSVASVAGLSDFRALILNECGHVTNPREKFECLRVCWECGEQKLAHDLATSLIEKDYAPSLFWLGIRYGREEFSCGSIEEALSLLRRSSRPRFRGGSFLYFAEKRKQTSNPLLKIYYFIRTILWGASVFSRIEELGEPLEKSQISD